MRALALTVLVAGCGSVDGFPCEAEFASQCDGIDVAHCERADSGDLKWRVYECPGVCGLSGCNWTGAKVGTPCPARNLDAWCSADGEMTQCLHGGSFDRPGVVQANPCPRCVKGADPKTVLVRQGDVYTCN